MALPFDLGHLSPLLSFDDSRAFVELAGSECAFGVFDGYHLGHRFIVDKALRASKRRGSRMAIVTFDIDPDELFRAGNLKKLMSNEMRLRILRNLGADFVAVLPFTCEFAALQPIEFLEKVFSQAAPSGIHVGSDFRFGCKASGTVETMRAWGSEHGMEVSSHELLGCEGAPITSTRIRNLLASCEIEAANELLGARHTVSSPVESGRGEGAALGFKTANLLVPEELCVLGDGVYGAYAHIDGRCYKAAVSWGIPPTFEGVARHNCEAHILDFDGDLYGRELTLEFSSFLRPMRVFPTTEELIAMVTANIEWVRKNL